MSVRRSNVTGFIFYSNLYKNFNWNWREKEKPE